MPINTSDTGDDYFKLEPLKNDMLSSALSTLNPFGLSYWSRCEFTNTSPRRLVILGGTTSNEKPALPLPKWKLYRITDFEPLPAETNSQAQFTRFITNYLGLALPNTDNRDTVTALLGDFLNGLTTRNPANAVITERFDIGKDISSPFGIFSRPPGSSRSIVVTVEFISIPNNSAAWIPVLTPLPTRQPRKWGRSLTKRWEDEHRQLVDHRKFERNRKKVIADPHSIGTGKKRKKKVRTPLMERDLLNSILNKGERAAKRAAIAAAKAATTETRKHIEKRGAKRVRKAVIAKLKRFGHGPAEPTKKKPALKKKPKPVSRKVTR